jgi:hypothetical protein
MTAQRPSIPTRPEPSARVERLGVTRQFIALKREIESINSHVNHGGQS